MPQRHLPFFPQGVSYITRELAFSKERGQVTYFNGQTAPPKTPKALSVSTAIQPKNVRAGKSK